MKRMDNKKKDDSSIGGVMFVGCMLIGGGIGMLLGNVAAGGAIGMGVGFATQARQEGADIRW